MNELTIALISILAYSKTIFFGEIVDDVISRKAVIKASGKPIKWLKLTFYGGGTFKNLKLDHAFTLFLHTVICVLIYKAFGSNEVSLLSAILYSVNPCNNQTSVWLNGRRYCIAIILMLLIVISPWFLTLYPLVAVFQINAILAPVLVEWWLIILIPLSFLFLKRTQIANFIESRLGTIPAGERRILKPRKLIISIKTLWFYFKTILFPLRKGMYYDYLENFANSEKDNKEGYALDRHFWTGLTLLGGLAVSTLFFLQTPFAFGFWFWVLFQLQWSNIVTVTQHLCDRYVSLSSIFLMYALSWVIMQLPIEAIQPVVITLVTIYLAELFVVFRQYHNLEEMLDYNLYYFPRNITNRSLFAKTHLKGKDFIRALDIAKEGLRYFPKDFKLNFIVANSLLYISPQEAKYYLKIAKENLYLGQEDQNLEQIKVIEDELRRMDDKTKKLQRQG